jgi:hypothetical protein
MENGMVSVELLSQAEFDEILGKIKVGEDDDPDARIVENFGQAIELLENSAYVGRHGEGILAIGDWKIYFALGMLAGAELTTRLLRKHGGMPTRAQ